MNDSSFVKLLLSLCCSLTWKFPNTWGGQVAQKIFLALKVQVLFVDIFRKASTMSLSENYPTVRSFMIKSICRLCSPKILISLQWNYQKSFFKYMITGEWLELMRNLFLLSQVQNVKMVNFLRKDLDICYKTIF